MNPSAAFRDLDSRFKWLTAFFRSYYCFFALHPICEQLDDEEETLLPFRHLSNVLLYDTVISWCKIFGTDSEECHWKRTVKDHDSFRDFFYPQLAVGQEDFRLYQDSILVFRNKWVVHFDPHYEHDTVPQLDLAHKSALLLHEYLQRIPMESMYYSGSVSMIEFGQAVAAKFLSQLRYANLAPSASAYRSLER